MSEKTQHLIDRLREVFHARRYGDGAEYHPDFDLFDAAADEIERLRDEINRLRGAIHDPRSL